MTKDLYFEWLLGRICCGTSAYKRKYFSMLLWQLYSTDYTWKEPLDEDRATWGLTLRAEYSENTGKIAKNKLNLPCSMLEMMVMLAIRMEYDLSFEDDPDFYDHVSDWFWGMITSMGLSKNDDYDYSDKKTRMAVTRVLGRTFKANGDGGLFTLTINSIKTDMRKCDIWHQAMLYRAELDDINDPDWLQL